MQGDGPYVYWTEGRPEEGGRQVIVRARPGSGDPPEDVLPAPFSARSRVHEYGGAEMLVADGIIYFVDNAEQDIWRLVPGAEPERITKEPTLRFADMMLDPVRSRMIAIGERHKAGTQLEQPDNLIVAIDLEGERRGSVVDLVTGRDFYAFPRLSPCGRRLAFLGWDLPDMPWDQSALYLASVRGDGSIGRAERIAGGNGVAAMQPQWLDDKRLLFLSDETGFGNLRLWDGESVRAVTRLATDIGLPMWNLGTRSFVVTGPDRVVASADVEGTPSLAIVTDLAARKPAIELRPATAASSLGPLTAFEGGVAGPIGRAKAAPAIAGFMDRRKAPIVLRTATDLMLEPNGISTGRTVSFRGGDRKTTFAQYYPPVSALHRAPPGTRPPALILAHGGPTASAARGLGLRIQYYTSRGFAVLDVDYAGSTGYGRAYRQRLDGQWGIADVADCAAGAKFLAREGLADPARIAIAGGSAGGYTVLMALATTKVFAAGSSHYGISDLSLLMEGTHKFEAGYLHRLLGTTARSWKSVCKARSPITLIDGMSAPLILFQGLDDKVVPPEQSRLIHEQLKARGIATELYEFAGESHGFRQAETIINVATAELAFLREALALAAPADASTTAGAKASRQLSRRAKAAS
jgi:dipeptidyl aminopeptidase/acylaminoacyl peptidase